MFVRVLYFISFFAITSAFISFKSSKLLTPRLSLNMMQTRQQGTNSPGPGMKPMADGTFKMAGEHPKSYVLENDNGARAEIRTYGCNTFTYTTKEGIEVMGVRKDALLDDSKPYAGGAPHCFPQFGPGELMQHGFARGMDFVPEERAKKLSFDRMIFKLVPTEETIKVWDYPFEYRVDITLREDCLEWEIILKNTGDKSYDVTLGMHNYFKISSLNNIKITSDDFKNCETMNRNDGDAMGKCDTDTIIINEPTDMLYKGVSSPINIEDSGRGTITTIERTGFPDTCIWNPVGDERMGFDDYICVEPVLVDKTTIPVGKFKETAFYQKVSCKKI